MALASYFDPSNRGARLARKNMHSAQPEGASEYSRGETASRYTKKRKSRGRHKVLRNIFIIIAIVLVSGVGAAWAYINNINSRLSEGVDSELRESLTETQSGEPFYMLLLGIDKNEKRVNGSYGADDSAYRSDSIMLARIDPTAKKVTLVSIPRDTYVDMGVNGQEKINAAYSFGGAAYATKVISDFAGVPISHYAEVDMDGMAAVVDAVGGIDVNLPVAVQDPYHTKLDLPAGEQHLDGKTAAKLCRARHAYDNYGGGDFYRAANQRTVIAAIAKKVLASDPVTMANTVSEMANMVKTDMSVGEIVSLASQMVGMDIENDIMSGQEPTKSVYTNETWYEICDIEAWQQMMERVDAGLSPLPEGEQADTDGISASLPGVEVPTPNDGTDGSAGSSEGTSVVEGSDSGDSAESIDYAGGYSE